MKKNTSQKGFTILEIIVSISLFTFVILLVNSMYTLSQKSYSAGANQGELTQNIRVSLDRLSREIRQSEEIVTVMPATSTDILNPPVNEIFFQDGHDISNITYVRYYLNGADLMRAHIAYYFDVNPATYVRWDSLDATANPPHSSILENRIVGEYFDRLEFWGENNLVHISLGLEKNNSSLNITTSVFSRN